MAEPRPRAAYAFFRDVGRAAADGADPTVVSTSPHHLLIDVVFGAIPDRLATGLDCTGLMVHSN